MRNPSVQYEEGDTCTLNDAAGSSLSTDAAVLYFRSPEFAAAFDRAVIDYLPLRQRITTPIAMRITGRMAKDRRVPWEPAALIVEIARRSSRVQDAKARRA